MDLLCHRQCSCCPRGRLCRFPNSSVPALLAPSHSQEKPILQPVIPMDHTELAVPQRRSHRKRDKSQIPAFRGELKALQSPGLHRAAAAGAGSGLLCSCWELCSQTLPAPAELRGSPVGVGEDLKTIIVLYFSSLITKQSCPLPLATIFSSCSHGAGGERLLPLCLIPFSSEAFSFLLGLLGGKRAFSKRMFCSGVFVIIGVFVVEEKQSGLGGVLCLGGEL